MSRNMQNVNRGGGRGIGAPEKIVYIHHESFIWICLWMAIKAKKKEKRNKNPQSGWLEPTKANLLSCLRFNGLIKREMEVFERQFGGEFSHLCSQKFQSKSFFFVISPFIYILFVFRSTEVAISTIIIYIFSCSEQDFLLYFAPLF